MNETNAKTAPQETNPTSLFDHRATDYVKYRPSYPAAAIDTIIEGLGAPSSLTAADIGAGTGIASRLLAERGLKVISIEPNASMREAAAPHPLIDSRDATAEQTNLPNECVDLVTCFQAFHWFKPLPTLQEFRRILKPSGQLALTWNDWVASDFFTQFSEIICKAVPNRTPGGKHSGATNPLWSSPDFICVRTYKFMHTHELDLSGLIGYAQSKSSVPREGLVHQQLISDLQELHARWALGKRGIVSLHYCASVYLAKPQTLKLNYRKLISPWLLGNGRKMRQALTNSSSVQQ